MNFLHVLIETLTKFVASVILLVHMAYGSFGGYQSIPVEKPVFAVPYSIPLVIVASTSPILKVQKTVVSVLPKPHILAKEQSTTSAQKKSTNIIQSPVSIPKKTPSQVNSETREAVVNILCTTQGGGYLNPISGSGVIVQKGGVILTNAHVGQYFLLRDYPTNGNVDCVVRTGSPAMAKYHAKLLYLPPSWITANATQITAQQAMGTGEDDYSFLLITSSVDNSPLPIEFPQLLLTFDDPIRDKLALLVAYPAGFIDGATVEKNLYASSAITTIGDIFAFTTEGNADLFSIGGTVVSQAGSSGGAAVRIEDGALFGIISTATEGTTTASRNLRAITLTHIEYSLRRAGQDGLSTLLSGDLYKKMTDFNTDIAPQEREQLIKALKH